MEIWVRKDGEPLLPEGSRNTTGPGVQKDIREKNLVDFGLDVDYNVLHGWFVAIKMYGSTSFFRISEVLKWPPIHKVLE